MRNPRGRYTHKWRYKYLVSYEVLDIGLQVQYVYSTVQWWIQWTYINKWMNILEAQITGSIPYFTSPNLRVRLLKGT